MSTDNPYFFNFLQLGKIELIEDKLSFIHLDGTCFSIKDKTDYPTEKIGLWRIIPTTLTDGKILYYQTIDLITFDIDSDTKEECNTKGIVTLATKKGIVQILVKNPPNPKIKVCFHGKNEKIKLNHLWQFEAARINDKLVITSGKRENQTGEGIHVVTFKTDLEQYLDSENEKLLNQNQKQNQNVIDDNKIPKIPNSPENNTPQTNTIKENNPKESDIKKINNPQNNPHPEINIAQTDQTDEFEIEILADGEEGAILYIPPEVVLNDPRWKYLATFTKLKGKWQHQNMVMLPTPHKKNASNQPSNDYMSNNTSKVISGASPQGGIATVNTNTGKVNTGKLSANTSPRICVNCMFCTANTCTNARSPLFATSIKDNNSCPEFTEF
jgi:hypothetical protein